MKHEMMKRGSGLASTCRIYRSADNEEVHRLAFSSTVDGMRHQTSRSTTTAVDARRNWLWHRVCATRTMERGCCELGSLKGDKMTFHGSLSAHAGRRCNE